MLSPSSTYQELQKLGGRQLRLRQIPYLGQPGAGYVLSSTVPRYGYNRRPTSSYMVQDPLGTQAVRRPGHHLGRSGEDFLYEFTSYIFKFYLFLALFRNFNSLLHAEIFSFGGRC
jgi:hypothetical protein